MFFEPEEEPSSNDKFELGEPEDVEIKTITMSATLTLRRVIAKKNFGRVKEGDIGGYVQNESNLSVDDTSWISGDAKVVGTAIVMDNARVTDSALVYNSTISGRAIVCENAFVKDSLVTANAQVFGSSTVVAQSIVKGRAKIFGSSVMISSVAEGNASVFQSAIVESSSLMENAKVYSCSRIRRGKIWDDMLANVENLLYCTVGVLPVEGKFRAWITSDVEDLEPGTILDRRIIYSPQDLSDVVYLTDNIYEVEVDIEDPSNGIALEDFSIVAHKVTVIGRTTSNIKIAGTDLQGVLLTEAENLEIALEEKEGYKIEDVEPE